MRPNEHVDCVLRSVLFAGLQSRGSPTLGHDYLSRAWRLDGAH